MNPNDAHYCSNNDRLAVSINSAGSYGVTHDV